MTNPTGGTAASEPELWHGLTMWGETISAQLREHGGRWHLALHVLANAPRSPEDGHPVVLPPDDVARLRALFAALDARTPTA